MLFKRSSSSLVLHKRKSQIISCLAQILLLILSTLVDSNRAGVIKKRDTANLTATPTRSGSFDLERFKETDVLPTILTALNNASVAAVETTKLQTQAEPKFVTESSKELTNNEIFTKKALTLSPEKAKEEAKLKANRKEKDLEFKDLTKILENLEEKPKTTTEFSSNDIKEEKIQKLKSSPPAKAEFNGYESSSSLENSLKIDNENPKPASKVLTELRTGLETTKEQNAQIENGLEGNKELEELNSLKPLEGATVKPFDLNNLQTFTQSPASLHSEENFLQSEKLNGRAAQPKVLLETSTLVAKVNENSNGLPTSTRNPLKDSESETEIKITEQQSNKIGEDLEHKDLLRGQSMIASSTPSLWDFDETQSKPVIKEKERNKQQHARSMFREESATISSEEDEDLLKPFTSLKESVIGAKERSLKDQVEDFNKTNLPTVHVKGKKPKFINDNSTNAQQLNLPNNAEVWSLAAMKSLPKSNVSLETASALNHTNKEFKENPLHNNSFTLNNNNSEKNLLDWSQIMMDKELSTTARNGDYRKENLQEIQTEKEESNKTKDLETFFGDSTSTTETAQSKENMVTQSTLIENELSTSSSTSASTISSVSSMSPILSTLNYNDNENKNNNQPDKKIEENMNNYIDMFTTTPATLSTNTSSTSTGISTSTNTVASNVVNNPFNTSLSIEPNLNEINLTSNQTQADDDLNINNSANNKSTTAGKENANNDVNADAGAGAYKERSTVAAPTTTTTSTPTTSTSTPAPTPTTKATAVVVDMMTTVEQISSETTTVSSLESSKQYASLDNVVITEKQKQKENSNNNNNYNNNNNVIYKESNSTSLPILNNELENAIVDKQRNNKNEIIDLNEQTVATTTTNDDFVSITTFRPSTILAITSTISPTTPATYEQEVVDQNGNEIQTNLTDFNYNYSTKVVDEVTHLAEEEFETTTSEILTERLPYTTTKRTTAATVLKAGENENTLTTTTTTATSLSYSPEERINETTEINLEITVTTTEPTEQTTPKQVNAQHKGEEEVEGEVETLTTTTTGSSPVVSTGEKFEKESKTKATTETNFSATTATETPVATEETKGDKAINASITPTATTTTVTTTTEQSSMATTATTTSTTVKQENDIKENISAEEDAKSAETTTTAVTTDMDVTKEITTTTTPTTTTTTTITLPTATAGKEEETYIKLLNDTTTATQDYSSTSPTTQTTHEETATTLTTPTTAKPTTSTSPPLAVTTRVEEIYNVINSTTTELIQTTTQQLLTTEIKEKESESSLPASTSTSTSTTTYFTELVPPATTTPSSHLISTADIGKTIPSTLTTIMGGNSGNMYPKNSQSGETDVNVIIAITVSVIGVVALILLVGFLYIMRKRQKQTSYTQRCRPVSLNEYTIDNASVSGSMRKSSALRASKRTYGNLAFDDPELRPNPMGTHELAKFVQERLRIFEEFRDVPQITSRLDEVPTGCEDKNRYANVLPLPETRVILQRLNDDEKSEYINANYVTGPKDTPNYYIACQAPLETTVEDFWRMIWEQQSRVIIQATDLIENGVEKCAEYLPPSVTLDNHCSFGDFQITLQNREVKDKYAISTILLKHTAENVTRELTHYWYKWPEVGVPTEEAPIIAMLLEARSSLISYAIEQANEDKEKSLKVPEEVNVSINDAATLPKTNANVGGSGAGSLGANATSNTGEINGNLSMVHIKKATRNQGPLTIHCSPGTGRTGTIIACDIAIRSLETPKRTVDIPQIVYYVRRGRASAVLTKEQYEFIYKVANMYAVKITNPTNYN